MKRSLLVIGIILCCIPAYSWDLLGNAGSRGLAMGSCSVAVNDFWSIQNNPAGMALWSGTSVGISYENRFLMKELGYCNVAGLLPRSVGTFGLSYSRFGFEDYNENKVGLAFARAFGKYLRVGLQLDYLAFKFSDDYANRRTTTFELGLQSDITDALCLGVYIFNPINVKIKTETAQQVPAVFRLGLSYRITDDFLTTTEIEYSSDKHPDYRIGMEYLATKEFYIRLGVHTDPASVGVGVGYTLNRVIIDASVTTNQHTGVSFQTSLIFNIK